MIITGDALDELKKMEVDSIDAVICDPPYGYSFMGKDWDKAVPSVDIWRECLRVLKPGGWCMVMSAPRSDVQNAMISRLMEAGFRLDFTPIYWTYASGFPKAGNVGKLVDKRLGVEREVVGMSPYSSNRTKTTLNGAEYKGGYTTQAEGERNITAPASDHAKALDGSYTGFQPKPAVEVIIVAMKPLSEKTYVDQALKNGKGITWLDDGRIPTGDLMPPRSAADIRSGNYKSYKGRNEEIGLYQQHDAGRFPANLLVQDDVLNDGVERKSPAPYKRGSTDVQRTQVMGHKAGELSTHKGDSGSYSRYFDLDKWYEQNITFPFAIFAKASKSEKNKGLEHLEPKFVPTMQGDRKPLTAQNGTAPRNGGKSQNNHPTVKPLKLMSYLITLTTREGDTVLDPFVGSGTTVIAAKQLGRKGIGIERESEYAEIAEARLQATTKLTEQTSLI